MSFVDAFSMDYSHTKMDFALIWASIHCHHRHDAVTDSTNTQLIQAVSTGKLSHRHHHLYTADAQSAGRGQHGRSWVSGQGNVFLSLYTPMQTDSDDGFGLLRLDGFLSLAVGYELARLDVIQAINAERAKQGLSAIGVKWANDVGYYDDTAHLFQKLCGILIEPVYAKVNDKTRLVGVVTGVGLNVEISPTIKDGLYQATCLRQLADMVNLGELPTYQALYQPICQAICQAVYQHNQLSETTAKLDFIDAFNRAHVLMGKAVNVFARDDMQSISQSGRCIGIDHDGALLLEQAGSTVRVLAGMIQSA